MKGRVLLLLIWCSGVMSGFAQIERTRTVTLMGSRFDITLIDSNIVVAEANIDKAIAEISRIENLISDWLPQTEISQVNSNAGIRPVRVSAEVFDLTRRALYYSQITGGAFDISYAAVDKIWKFDGSMKQIPTPEQVKNSVALVNYQNVLLDSTQHTLFLRKQGMKISFGSIGKAYAADKARQLMEKLGVSSGIIDASGDVTTWGTNLRGKAWRIGITNPYDEEKYLAIVPLERQAIVTSGSYEKFVELDGIRYAHIINPATGYPAQGLISVTVMGPNAELANGFSTAMMVLGIDKSLALLTQFTAYSAVFVTDKGEIVKSANFSFKVKRRIK